MDNISNYRRKPGPKPKEETSKQVSVTFPPNVLRQLEEYMRQKGLNNRSGTISEIVRVFTESCSTS